MNKPLPSLLTFFASLFVLTSSAQVLYQTRNGLTTSHKSGFYSAPFNLEISTAIPGDSILYTLDGSDPRFSKKAFRKKSSVLVPIDPASTIGRDATPGVTVRAVAKNILGTMQVPISQTFVFIDKVKTQTRPNGTLWPAPYPINSQIIDYNMDSRVVNSTLYKDSIDDALLQIPTLSITTSIGSLFAQDTGIYVNALQDGSLWERQASVELINPDNTTAFQVEAGLRIRGGYSRQPWNPKHAFRLFFRSEYGYSKLKYPLFGKEGTDEFDKLDIRTSQNYSWSYTGDSRNIMVRDIFNRDLQAAMGQPYTRGSFYHLYLDGMYWGIFQSEERPSASFGASYFGGTKDDYDVIKVETSDNYTIEATDGNLNAWASIWNLCQQGFTNNNNFYKIQGLDATGKRDTTLPVLVDLHNLIDYMLLIFYTGNVDAPVSEFLNNDQPNNFYAIYNRVKKNGFKFIAHDSEHTLLVGPGDVGDGVYENRVNIGSNGEMIVNSFESFQPQWLHYKLSANPNYRLMFADHVYKHFFNNGALTITRLKEMFMKRVNEINVAIMAESARWGDSKTKNPRTKVNDWLPEVNNVMKNFFPVRGDIVLKQLQDENLYNNIKAPLFTHQSKELDSLIFVTELGEILNISNPNGQGFIYYTTNGSDPRSADNTISLSANSFTGSGSLEIKSSFTLKARIFANNNWSPLHELMVYLPEEMKKLKLTEIHYHPLSQDSLMKEDDLEFIELKNTGKMALSLKGISVTDGISYTFPDTAMLGPGQIIVLASKPSVFEKKYGFKPYGNYMGHLKNSGESILVNYANGDTITYVNYSDTSPWAKLPDGYGPSLVTVKADPTGNQNLASEWMPSYNDGGSPGKDDKLSMGVVMQERIAVRLFPNPVINDLTIDTGTDPATTYILTLTDIMGQPVYSKTLSGSEITNVDLSGEAAGVYILKINGKEFSKSWKVIKAGSRF